MFSVTFLFLLNQTVSSQELLEKKEIKAKGKVVAVDVLASSENLTFGLQQEIFIFRVEKLIQGNEDSCYIKVSYQYYTDPSPLLPQLLKGKDDKWKLKLERNQSCDSNLEELSYSKSYIIENLNQETLDKLVERSASESDAPMNGVEEGPKVLRLKDTGGLADVPKDKKLPCYILKTDNLKLAK